MPSRPAPPLITRRPPPAEVPLSQREKAMESHPGRPLEPQQLKNLESGKPAGAMRDREFPPHPPQAKSNAERPRTSEKVKQKSEERLQRDKR